MIKTIKKIGVLNGQFKMSLDIFECNPPFQSEDHIGLAHYLTGQFYQVQYPMVALYSSDEFGNIVNIKPIILEEGYPTYEALFSKFGYTLLNQ